MRIFSLWFPRLILSVFGIDDALLIGGASLLGGFMNNRANAKQQASANQMSWEQMNAQNQFNSQQAEVDFTRSRQAMYEANALNLGAMDAANNYQRFQNLEQMQFQDAQANKQMAFQERLANTAHQREILDLRAAGLNPILSGTGGMGAATPSGAMGTGHAGGPGALGVSGPSARGYASGSASFGAARLADVVSPALSSAVQAMQGLQSVELGKAQENKTRAEAARAWTQAGLDPKYAQAEREEGLALTHEQRYRTQHEGRSAAAKADVDTGTDRPGGETFTRQERQAALGFLREQSKHQAASARSAEVAAGLDEEFRGLERSIGMGGGAVTALKQLLWMLRK